jgi:hypothetical protein
VEWQSLVSGIRSVPRRFIKVLSFSRGREVESASRQNNRDSFACLVRVLGSNFTTCTSYSTQSRGLASISVLLTLLLRCCLISTFLQFRVRCYRRPANHYILVLAVDILLESQRCSTISTPLSSYVGEQRPQLLPLRCYCSNLRGLKLDHETISYEYHREGLTGTFISFVTSTIAHQPVKKNNVLSRYQ